MLGKYSYGGTPRHIPNLEVKPIHAESTWLEATWEDMNLPSFFYFLENFIGKLRKYCICIEKCKKKWYYIMK